MFETAIRSGELVDLQLDDLDLIERLITIRRGKGGRGRVIPIGQATTEALLVYLDEREQHPLAHAPDLWLGNRGKQFGREGLSRSLRRRAQRAGVQGFRPHRLRHTAAHRWLAAGGSESGLMAIAGWTRTDMLVRYTRARAAERAAAEASRLNLGQSDDSRAETPDIRNGHHRFLRTGGQHVVTTGEESLTPQAGHRTGGAQPGSC